MPGPPPDDILHLIFSELVRADDEPDVWPRMSYNHRAAQAPFIVAAVCQRWRVLALATSNLWTYFGFPPADFIDPRHQQRLECLQLRVGSAPIDVVFGWPDRDHGAACKRHIIRSIRNGILSRRSQWRTAILHVGGSSRQGWKFDQLFQASTWLQLEEMSLTVDDIVDVVPFAPRLRRFYLDCDRSMVDEPFVVKGYPALSTFGLFCDSTPLLRWFPAAFGSQLTELVLVDDYCKTLFEVHEMRATYTFPILRSLILDDGRWLRHINAPTVTKLTLTHLFIHRLTPELTHQFVHLTELVLCGKFRSAQLICLRHFSDITTLSFSCPPALSQSLPEHRDFYRIESGALQALAKHVPPILPGLKRLHFAMFTPAVQQQELAVVAADLVDFVTIRNTLSAGVAGTAFITQVVAEYPGAPRWLQGKLDAAVALQGDPNSIDVSLCAPHAS